MNKKNNLSNNNLKERYNMKKAFTLIELLAVIVILAVVAIVATPVILDVIEDSRNSANKSSANMILSAANNYYTESLLDITMRDKLDGKTNLFYELDVENKPEDGVVYINEDGKVALVIPYSKKCYVKSYNTNIEEYDIDSSECDLSKTVDAISPIVELTLIEGTVGNDNWYKTETYVKVKVTDDSSGFKHYKWCQGVNCAPNEIETINESSKLLVDSNEAGICVQGVDNAGNVSEVVCSEVVKVDTVSPEFKGIEDLKININDEIDLISGVEVSDVTSGLEGTFTTNPTTLTITQTGEYEVKYIAIDKAGNEKEVTRKVIVSANAPDITFEEDALNEYGWAKEDFYVTISVIDNTGKGIKEVYVCTSNESDRCEPTNIDSSIKDNKITRLIATESNNNRICVKAIDNENQSSEVICSDAYKLDKTDPVVGSINVNGGTPSEGWYKEDIAITTNEGTDGLSGHLSTTVDVSSITENTEGKVVTVTTKDKAGNTITKEYTLKLDKTQAIVEITKATNSTKLTATITPTTTISNYSYKWYQDGNLVSNATTNTYTPNAAGTYKLEVTTGAGKVATSNEITINSYTITYNLNGGTGNISNTTKVEDINTNITSTIPTKEGYTFQGWGSSTTDTTVDYLSNASYTANENKTLYAIWKKTITITFVANGATISKESVTCDMYNADTSCKVTFPTITRSGFTITGFNTDSTATTSQVASGAEKSVSANATYYAITSKQITITFYRNGATSITPKGGSASTTTSLTQTCTIRNSVTNCSITSPTITASSNTPTVLGWNTSASSTSSAWSQNTAKTFTDNASYYAITKKDAITYTATFNANNATLVDTTNTDSATKDSCTIDAVYNGATQGTSCTVYSPNITGPSNTPTVVGFNTSATATASAWAVNTSKTISSNVTYYAITTKAKTTLTAKFNANGATLSSASNLTCDLAATYNGAAQATSCTVTAPTITRSGFTITGYNTSASATANNSSYNTSTRALTLTTSNNNSTWYAITSKVITITYSANGGSGSMTPSTCTIQNSATTCQVYLKDNAFTKTGYKLEGWGKTTSSTSYGAGQSVSFSSDTTLYAIWITDPCYGKTCYSYGTLTPYESTNYRDIIQPFDYGTGMRVFLRYSSTSKEVCILYRNSSLKCFNGKISNYSSMKSTLLSTFGSSMCQVFDDEYSYSIFCNDNGVTDSTGWLKEQFFCSVHFSRTDDYFDVSCHDIVSSTYCTLTSYGEYDCY